MTAKASPEMIESIKETITRITTSQPGYIILRKIKGDQIAGPFEWKDGVIEHSFDLTPGDTITGWACCHPDGTVVYESGHCMRVGPGDKTYTVFLSVANPIVSNA
jgi:hypothetical protein